MMNDFETVLILGHAPAPLPKEVRHEFSVSLDLMGSKGSMQGDDIAFTRG